MGLIGAGGEGFLNTIFTFILNALLSIFSVILGLVFGPLESLIQVIFPSLDNAESIFSNFLSTYAIPGITFARELFINITGYPRQLLSMLALIFIAKITFHIAVIPIKFIIRVINAIFHMFPDPPSGGVVST